MGDWNLRGMSILEHLVGQTINVQVPVGTHVHYADHPERNFVVRDEMSPPYTPIEFNFVEVEVSWHRHDGVEVYTPDDPRLEFENTNCEQCGKVIGGFLNGEDDERGRPTAGYRAVYICTVTGAMLCEDCSCEWDWWSPSELELVAKVRSMYPATHVLTDWEILRSMDERFA